MSDHILDLLGAYVDGELHGRQLHAVETHLNECDSCRAELQSLQALSNVLKEAPLPEFSSADRFASNVTLRLARRPETSPQRRALEIGWWLVPVGLLVAWIFVNTTIFVSNAVSVASETGLFDGHAAWLTSGTGEADWSAALGQFGLLTGNSLQAASRTEMFTRTAIPEIAW